MNTTRSLVRLVGVIMLWSVVPAFAQAPPSGVASQGVELCRVPNGGIQPQAEVGGDGTIHLVYYKGDPKAGDLYYVKRPAAGGDWSEPVRVNSDAGSAVALGNDRGGQLALGRDGTIHVAWNGSGRGPAGPERSSPMLYSRLVRKRTSFEPQRNLMTASCELDGGGSVAADPKGNVYVVWHAVPTGTRRPTEADRRVLVAVSPDDGATFSPEAARSDPANGACGCCGLKAAVRTNGEVLVMYRAARDRVHRGMQLMRSMDGGRSFEDTAIDDWEVASCPMTTADIEPTGSGEALAWEHKDGVRWRPGSGGTKNIPVAAKPDPTQKYPVIAVDQKGQTLVAWTEGLRWNTGGRLRWQLFDSGQKAVERSGGEAEGVPAWSLVAVIAKPDGGFIVIY